jgi:phospholipid/cholesterol/gamma-HCH transport system ATP-binding protein
MQDSVVEISAIQTTLNSRMVHRDLSFAAAKGEITALIAASGGGKSVLLREILGLMRPDAGIIKVLGVDLLNSSLSDVNALRNRLGVLFQNGALFSALTVAENIAVPLFEHSNLAPKEVKEIVELKLAMVGLEARVGELMPSELSGGMRKRAALARALALEPELLFLDEPTSGLDPISSREFDQLIQTLNKSLGLSLFLITHDPESLWSIADKVVCLAEGRVIEQGTVEALSQSSYPWLRKYFSNSQKTK